MIAILELYNENTLSDTFEKEFKDEEEMYSWLRNQQGHPFLSYSLKSIKDKLHALHRNRRYSTSYEN